jgi:uncharacterized protein YecE (DUF72 family)
VRRRGLASVASTAHSRVPEPAAISEASVNVGRAIKALTRESELEEWAQRIERWRRDRDVYAYFNNDREGFAVRNALRLKVRNALRLKKRLGV